MKTVSILVGSAMLFSVGVVSVAYAASQTLQIKPGDSVTITCANGTVVTPSPAPSPSPAPTPAPSSGSIALSNVYITGYADGDNTPPGSPETYLDGIEGVAGGNCTYDNPTTMAVGHVITNGNDKADFAYGTKFYVPALKCYFKAADTCGDGPTPQNRACHKPERGSLQLDAYVGPKGTASCEEAMTGIYNVIQNPIAGLPVNVGNICK